MIRDGNSVDKCGMREEVMGRLGFLWLITGVLSACAHGAAHQGAPMAPPAADTLPVTSHLIFDTKSGESLSEEQLKRRFIETPWLLWGEQHDQAQHHALRARWLADWAGALPADQPAVGRAAYGAASAGRAKAGHRTQAAIVFEHLDREHGAALRQVQARQPRAPLAEWLVAARFDAKRWGGAAYEPLFEAAWQSGVPWVAGNLSRETARQWMMMAGANGGPDGMAGSKGAHRVDGAAGATGGGAADIQGGMAVGAAKRLGRDAVGVAASTEAWLAPRLAAYPVQPSEAGWLAALQGADWDARAEARLLAAVRVGHCDALPESMLVTMAAAQRLRDAALADALKRGAAGPVAETRAGKKADGFTQNRAVPVGQRQQRDEALPSRLLLTGNGHVDRRFGVPRYLGVGEAQVLVVGMEAVSAAALLNAASSVPTNEQGPMNGQQAQVPTNQQQARRLSLSDWVGEERASRMAEAYDLVVLTPVSPGEVPDHCAAFRQGKAPAGGRKAPGQAVAP